MPSRDPKELREALRRKAIAAGFDVVGVTDPTLDRAHQEAFERFLALGRNGDMDWLARNAARRAWPRTLWPQVRSIIALGMNYGPETSPLAALENRRSGVISCYAQGKDYHVIVKKALKRLARWLAQETGAAVKVFVDTAPVLEKPLAARAGLGWQGKHTNLVSRRFGSWLFLGSIFTTAEIAPDRPERDHCGRCRRCLDICPTNAFPAPYELDARRCISYLTIEHKGHIPRALRPAMGNRVFGCDDCLAVCPWNKFAKVAREQRFSARAGLDSPPLEELLALDHAAFAERFKGTPIKRTGRDRFMRNVLIAVGNSGAPELRAGVLARLDDPSPLVRAMAVWAASRLLEAKAFARLRARYASKERDALVRKEWQAALSEQRPGLGVATSP